MNENQGLAFRSLSFRGSSDTCKVKATMQPICLKISWKPALHLFSIEALYGNSPELLCQLALAECISCRSQCLSRNNRTHHWVGRWVVASAWSISHEFFAPIHLLPHYCMKHYSWVFFRSNTPSPTFTQNQVRFLFTLFFGETLICNFHVCLMPWIPNLILELR